MSSWAQRPPSLSVSFCCLGLWLPLLWFPACLIIYRCQICHACSGKKLVTNPSAGSSPCYHRLPRLCKRVYHLSQKKIDKATDHSSDLEQSNTQIFLFSKSILFPYSAPSLAVLEGPSRRQAGKRWRLREGGVRVPAAMKAAGSSQDGGAHGHGGGGKGGGGRMRPPRA